MRLLIVINLITVVILAGVLGLMHFGAPLPWTHAPAVPATNAAPPAPAPAPAASVPLLRSAPAIDEADANEPPPAPAARIRLRFLTQGAYPPFTYRNGEGRLAGFDVDLARALCARLAADCTFATRRWRDLLPALKRGEGDAIVSSMLIPTRAARRTRGDPGVIFTGAYYSTPGHFVARLSSGIVAADAASLAGRRVAVQSGSAHEAFLKARFPNVVIRAAATLAEAETALAKGRADLVFADRNTLVHWMRSDVASACCRLVGDDHADPDYFSTGAGIVLRAGAEPLRDRMDRALSALAADGTRDRIGTQYFGQPIP